MSEDFMHDGNNAAELATNTSSRGNDSISSQSSEKCDEYNCHGLVIIVSYQYVAFDCCGNVRIEISVMKEKVKNCL